MNVQKKIAFYGALAQLISDDKFVKSSAEALVKLCGEIKSDFFTEGVTLEFLREAYEEHHDQKRDLDTIEQITEAAFCDLAKHMRSPEVRRIFTDLTGLAGTYGDEDLYVHTRNVRPLTEDADGMAVVTLVVNNYGGLKDLLKKGGGVEAIHSV
jgi:hypothetical protein